MNLIKKYAEIKKYMKERFVIIDYSTYDSGILILIAVLIAQYLYPLNGLLGIFTLSFCVFGALFSCIVSIERIKRVD